MLNKREIKSFKGIMNKGALYCEKECELGEDQMFLI